MDIVFFFLFSVFPSSPDNTKSVNWPPPMETRSLVVKSVASMECLAGSVGEASDSWFQLSS